ncbi:DNA modification methylase [alpha proteobacterium U9-1i]|nr:DNA modification methylase [alpha proteobacterium U9-1i]
MLPLGDIKPYSNNPRSRPKKQCEALAASIKQNGFNTPIVIDEADTIINGHGRYEAAVQLKLDSVPVVRVTHLSEGEKAAYRIADNKIASMSAWNSMLLPAEISLVAEAGINVETTGFSAAEVDFILDQSAESSGPDVEPEDALPQIQPRAVTRVGQTWALGKHRIMCADARDPMAVCSLMGEETARMAFADVPYNVKIDGFAVGAGATKHAEFAMASGEMSKDQFTTFLSTSLENLGNFCCDGAVLFVCIDWRHIDELSAAGKAANLKLLNLIVWAKTNGGMGTFYRSRHELIFAFKKGNAPHVNTFGLGEGGRYRTNVWDYRGANAFGPTRDEDLASHPTVKPARMVADAIKDVSRRGEIVLDLFGGSGTTLIAAEMTGRRARLMEIAPVYVDLTVRRWQKATGLSAVDAANGQAFDAFDVAEETA